MGADLSAPFFLVYDTAPLTFGEPLPLTKTTVPLLTLMALPAVPAAPKPVMPAPVKKTP